MIWCIISLSASACIQIFDALRRNLDRYDIEDKADTDYDQKSEAEEEDLDEDYDEVDPNKVEDIYDDDVNPSDANNNVAEQEKEDIMDNPVDDPQLPFKSTEESSESNEATEDEAPKEFHHVPRPGRVSRPDRQFDLQMSKPIVT